MGITIGRTVLYSLNRFDAAAIGYSQEGELVPMIVVKVWPNEFGNKPGVNGQLIVDSPKGMLWVTSKAEGTEPGTWRWPTITPPGCVPPSA